MASSARGERSNPYDGGLGTGGKFRKPTARRSQKTPYDRPPTSARNPGVRGGGEGRGGGGGWLSKLVDPAQRLITYGAHRLFASVFRKRLVSGETTLQSPEQHQKLPERDVMQEEAKVGHRENTSSLLKNDTIRIQEGNASGNPSKDGFTDLEKMLKGKSFTRSEVDRLTTLLRSKAADSTTVNGDQRNEASIARNPPSHERDGAHPDTGMMNALASTPLRSSRALDECIASPAQLAKAYMGSRPSEVTPSMLGLRGQAIREDSVFLNRTPFPSKSPTMSLVPTLSGQRPPTNGFVTPRSRGRSAVYSMARTPYSRPQSTTKVGPLFQASPSTWEERLSSGSRQGFQSGLKRRSSVLDDDLGSVGPVRRIRQKSNLSSRRLALPASESPLFSRVKGGQNITHPSKGAGDFPGSDFNFVPSKSKETASKILQEIDKMDSTREKSPSKLSPSMLRGPALKSLQNVEAPNFLNNLPEKKANTPSSSHQKQEKSRESGSKEILVLSEKTSDAAETSKAGSSKNQEARGKGVYLPLTSSLKEHPPKKRAFRMTADEDFDDDHGEASEMAEKQNSLNVEKGVGISMPKGEKPLPVSETMASKSYILNGDASHSTSNGSLETGRSQFSALPIEAVQQSNMPSEPTSKFIQGTEKSSIAPAKLTSVRETLSREEHKNTAAVFPSTFSSPATDFLNQNTGTSADIKLEKPSSYAFGKPIESKETVSNSASESESSLNGSIFSRGANAISQQQINGSLDSNPFSPSISNIPSNNSVREVPCTVQSFATTPAASSVCGKVPANTSNDCNSGSNSQSTPAPPPSSTSSFKFGEPAAAPFFAATVPTPSGQISKETEVKNTTSGDINSFKFGGMPSADTSTENAFASKSSENKSTFVFGSSSSSFGGSTLNPSSAASSAPGSSASLAFGVTSSSAPTPTPWTETSKFSWSSASSAPGSNVFAASTASSFFGFNAASSASAASSQSQASNLSVAANSQTGNIGSGSTTSTQSAPFVFGSSASAQTSNTGSGTTTSTQSSPFVFASSASAQTSNTGSGTTASTQSSPFVFASSTSTQTGNTGSGTTTSTQSAPFLFGSSASAPSSGLSGSNTSSNSSPFGLSKSEPAVFAFGSTPQLSSTNSSASSTGTTSSSLFGTNWQAPNSAPAFGSSFTTSSAPTFSFGGSSAATVSSASAPIFFSSTTPATPQQSVFGNSAPSTTLQSPFGNSTPGFAFGATAPPANTNGFNNNQQMSMEDSMAEDTDQANKASMVQQPMFGQQSASVPQTSFVFGGAPATPPPSMANPFQFGGQPTPQNASPFQASQSLEFQGGGSFSLGSTGGGDKSGRRIFKAKKTNRRK